MRKFIFPLLLFVVCLFYYSLVYNKIPVSYWDELIWVGRSYFFQFYLHGDFKNQIWYSYESYDQPKLGEYAFGAWLYPQYLREAKTQQQPYDFTQFLSHYHLYLGNLHGPHTRLFQPNDDGPPSFWVAKYGKASLPTINLIYDARELSVLLLSFAVVLGYFFAYTTVGFIPAVIFSVFYGFIPMLVKTGLKAQSEALFLCTFNAGLLLLTLYFTKRKVLYLLLFSVVAGLCMSTKLNGMMLILIFFVINTLEYFVLRKMKDGNPLVGYIPIVIGFIVLILLNPFTYPSPIRNTKYLFDWRMQFAATYQVSELKQFALPTVWSRLAAIFSSFYAPNAAGYYNGSMFLNSIVWHVYYDIVLGFFGLIGLAYLVKHSYQKKMSSIVVITSFIGIVACMCGYLVLNWDRYYIQLVLFFVLFQSVGLYVVWEWLMHRLKKLRKRHLFAK